MPTLSLDRLREMRLSVSIPLLFIILGATYSGGVQINSWYDQYHRELAREEAAIVMAAKSETLEKRVEETQKAVDETARKVDRVEEAVISLRVSAAIAAVAALQTELDRHERSPEDTVAWRKERDRIKRQVEGAVEYRDCLMDDRNNCERLRGW